MMKTNKLFQTFASQAVKELPPSSASEVLSTLFRQRGVLSLDSFTRMLIGSLRRAMKFNPEINGLVRKFMSITKWKTTNTIMTMWTVEPVVSSTVIRGNSINIRSAYKDFYKELDWIKPMSMTTHLTLVEVDNEIRGRWAGRLVCNMSSTLFCFTIYTTNTNMIHLVAMPEKVLMIASWSESVAGSLGVTVSVTTHGSTKISIRPSVFVNRNTSLRMLGNGSVQFCRSPTNIKVLFRAARVTVKRFASMNTHVFLLSMRQL